MARMVIAEEGFWAMPGRAAMSPLACHHKVVSLCHVVLIEYKPTKVTTRNLEEV